MAGHRAFTLLEMVVAIALTAVVAAAAYGMLYAGIAARNVVTGNALENRSLALALDQISRSVASAEPPTGILAGEFKGEDAVDGTNDSLTLHTCVDPYGTRWSDIRRVRFFVETDESGSPCLKRGMTSNLLASTAPTEDVQVLCRSVESFQASYFDGTEWTDTWSSADNGNALPAAVRLKITLAAASRDPNSTGRSASLERVVLPVCAAAARGATP